MGLPCDFSRLPQIKSLFAGYKIRPYVEWKITITSKVIVVAYKRWECFGALGVGTYEIWSLGLVFAYIRTRKFKCFHHNLPFRCSFGSSHNPKGTSDEALRTSVWEAILEALPGGGGGGGPMSLVRILKLLVLIFINASHSHCCQKLKKFFVFVGILEKGIAMGYAL